MKKIEKMSLIFEFSISKLGYTEIFFDPFFRILLTSQGKNEDEHEKIWENESSILEFSILKLGYVAIFLKICEKKF